MITQRVAGEMYKVRGYLYQIEIYTNRKRKWNRIVNFLIAFVAIIGAVFYKEGEYQVVTFYASLLVATATVARECLPFIVQPESEMQELDRLYAFYNQYLANLEHLYMLRFEEKSDVDNIKMQDSFLLIRRSEGSSEADINKLCRKMYYWENKKVIELTKTYFKTHFPEGFSFDNSK